MLFFTEVREGKNDISVGQTALFSKRNYKVVVAAALFVTLLELQPIKRPKKCELNRRNVFFLKEGQRNFHSKTSTRT